MYQIKDLYLEYIKDSYNSMKRWKKMKYPVKKWANDLNRQFSKGDLQVANKLMKRSSTLLSLGKCKSNHQTTVRYHFTPTRMPVIKKADSKKCWWGWGETELVYAAGGNMRDCSCCRESSLESEEQRRPVGGLRQSKQGKRLGPARRGVFKALCLFTFNQKLRLWKGARYTRWAERTRPWTGCLGVSRFPSWPAGWMELQLTERVKECKNRFVKTETSFWQGLLAS